MSADVEDRLGRLRSRIEAACRRCGREAKDVVLIGACKRQPSSRLIAAYEAGLRRFGENVVQEALAHREALPGDIEWHLIGPLQSNKVNKAVGLFTWVHSVDRTKIAVALDRVAERSGVELHGLLEINLGEEETKHGFAPTDLGRQVEALAELVHLRVEGLMAIPPLSEDPEASRPWFVKLRELRDELFSRPEWRSRPGYLSMGMSADVEVAVEEGATHVRIGTDLFGPRERR